MSFEAFTLQLSQLEKRLSKSNVKRIKLSLIKLQDEVSSSEMMPDERLALKESMEALFHKIRKVQHEIQQDFEREAAENYDFLKEQIVQTIDYTQRNLEELDLVWQKLIDVQNLFKGRKLVADEREQLYNTLQKLFDLVKKRREEQNREKEELSGNYFEVLDDEVEFVLKKCDAGDEDKTWALLLKTKDKVTASDLVFVHRKKLIDRLQEGFEILKVRREKSQVALQAKARENAEYITQQLQFAERELTSNPDFRKKWEILLAVQKEFKERKLEKETRNVLYDKLQDLFRQLKVEQFDDQDTFEKMADENIQYLTPLVDKAFELAEHASELKKAKAYLIKVQADFKGRKMRGMEREKLYARLQTAFDILNKRIEENAVARKENQEFRHSSRLAELEAKISKTEQSIEADTEKLEMLEQTFNNNKGLSEMDDKQETLFNQIELMRAAITRKSTELEVLYHEREKIKE
jgi:hypothetical protein